MAEMNRQQQLAPAQTQPGKSGAESEFARLVNQPHRGTCEYVPYGAQDKIKLTVPIIQNLIAVKTKTGATCSERDAIKFLAMCQAKRMNPFEGDCFLIGYDSRDGASFALVTAHQTYLKRAELHPEFDGMKSGVIVSEDGNLKDLEGDFFVDGQEVVGGWATVYFKNRKQEMHKRLRLQRFKKPFGIWQEDPAGMICKCAEADALRSSFPTMLGGLYLREEMAGPDPEFAKPEFKSLMTAPQLKPTELPSPENGNEAHPQSEYIPETPTPTPTPQAEKSPLLGLRNLLKIAKIKEGELLGYLSETAASDGSSSSLEELLMSQPNVIRLVAEQWGDISAKINEAKKGAS